MRPVQALGLIALLALWACSEAVPAADLEASVAERLTQLTQVEDPHVACPGDLPAEVDATIQCRFNDGERVLPVDVTVTGVDGDEITFDVEVGANPIG